MLILQILGGLGILLLGCIFAQLQEMSGGLTMISHQLEYLGAPLEVQGGRLVAMRRPNK
jgi:hypothetical protein